jgi:branched-chain amino acid transport system ATP-binding protein
MSLLEIDNVTVKFGGVVAVKDFSMNVEEGIIHSLIGPNGAGKTTLFNVITRVVRETKGTVHFDGIDLKKLKPHEVINSGITRTFQNLEIFKLMTVGENLLIGHHRELCYPFTSEIVNGKKAKEQEGITWERALEIAEMLNIKNRLNTLAGMLPYGLQKMVEIGRALMSEPRLLMLDEPAAGLNPSEAKRLKELIKKFTSEFGITVFLVEHDMSVVMDISDRITVMNFGVKIAEGEPESIRNNDEVIKAYLGESKYA